MKEGRDSAVKKVKVFEGTQIHKKYVVGSLIGKGSFGTVHGVLDLNRGGAPTRIVIKASEDITMLYKEVMALE